VTLDTVKNQTARCDRCGATMAIFTELLWLTSRADFEMLERLLSKLHLLCPPCASQWEAAGRPVELSLMQEGQL